MAPRMAFLCFALGLVSAAQGAASLGGFDYVNPLIGSINGGEYCQYLHGESSHRSEIRVSTLSRADGDVS